LFRSRYFSTLQVAPVVDLLLTDETNPRSVIYQLEALVSHVQSLPSAPDRLRSPQERIALSLLNDLKLTEIEPLCALDERGRYARLSSALLDLATRIPALSDSLSDRYLNHATVSRHLTLDETATPSELARGGDT